MSFHLTQLDFQLGTLWILAFEILMDSPELLADSPEFPACNALDSGVELPVDSPEFPTCDTLRILAFELPVDSPEFLACDAPDTGI